jgi:hypothetical protein
VNKVGGPIGPYGCSNWPARLVGATTLRERPTPERPLSPWVISTVSQRAGGDRRGGVADMDHQRAAADTGAVDPFRGEAEIMHDRHRRLAGIAMPSISAGLSPASAIASSAASACNWICGMSGMTPSRVGGADNGDRFRLHRGYLRAERKRGSVISSSSFSKRLDRHVELQRLGGLRAIDRLRVKTGRERRPGTKTSRRAS